MRTWRRERERSNRNALDENLKLKTPTYPVLDFADSIGNASHRPSQILIQGENLHALKALSFSYSGKIDCIYIDPPYNTGSADWRYNNRFVNKSDSYRHSRWLSFMEHRLLLAKKLLNPDKSVLICAIGEDEVHRLGMLLEQIFPEARIQMVSINTGSANTTSGYFTRAGEYLFFVMMGAAAPLRLEVSPDFRLHPAPSKNVYMNLQRGGTHDLRSDRPNEFYPIFIKDGKIASIGDPIPKDKHAKDVEIPEGCEAVLPMLSDGREGRWQVMGSTLKKMIEEHRVRVKGKSISYIKAGMWEELKSGVYCDFGSFPIDPIDGHLIVDSKLLKNHLRLIPSDIWNVPLHNASSHRTLLLKNLLGPRAFPFPKSLYAVEDAIRFFVADNPRALILDFFAGSGTTCHAVMRLNKQDGGERVCISVTNNENGICDQVTFPRLKACITGRRADGSEIEGRYKGRDESPISEGYEENLEYFKLRYADRGDVEIGKELFRILPLLWMASVSNEPLKAEEIKCRNVPYLIFDSFGLLTNYEFASEFANCISDNMKLVAISTFDDERYQWLASRFSGICYQLPQAYLRAMEMNGEI